MKQDIRNERGSARNSEKEPPEKTHQFTLQFIDRMIKLKGSDIQRVSKQSRQVLTSTQSACKQGSTIRNMNMDGNVMKSGKRGKGDRRDF